MHLQLLCAAVSHVPVPAQLLQGNLEWTPMHTSPKFWKENAGKLADNNCQLLKVVLELLKSGREVRRATASQAGSATASPAGSSVFGCYRSDCLRACLLSPSARAAESASISACACCHMG